MRWTLIALACFFVGNTKAQDTVRLSLPEILQLAESNYPKLKSNRYELEASKANIKLQQQTIIPQLDATYQANLATHNNITGMLQPQYVLPISGPPSSENDYSPVTGSAASLLFQWQPGIFGDRKSKINLAAAASQTLQSKNAQEIFNHKVKVCNQFIDIVYYRHLLNLYEENIHISERQLKQVNVLAVTGLKPGIDTALIQAELSRTRIEWLKIKNAYDNILLSLQESVASDSIIINSDTSFYNTVPAATANDTIEHPFGKTARLTIEESKTNRITISKLTAPRLSFWGTTYARGSGVDYTGAIKSFNGFNLNRFNYGVGVQLSVPILNHTEVKTRLQQQDLIIRSDQEKLNQVTLALKKQRKLSEATFLNAIAVIKETPVQVNAAEYAFNAMQVRYTTGLVNYSELLQTQFALLKAKIEQARSQAELWKALLLKAAVYGDLNLFINQVK
ncbi:outer membrane protein TolC [Lacibacter cauensis]|uniref:Outer membrane protein TolC n=1 Tax=Lacibacter cauensis TaxID=510947 RepID=A0A562SDW0_9BACT|nr:TolC family protein [Lacibacter cauensis]TWI78996.1 outer membrane protein TolC [Lacibacter cauensis]